MLKNMFCSQKQAVSMASARNLVRNVKRITDLLFDFGLVSFTKFC